VPSSNPGPIVRSVPADEARCRRARISEMGAEIEAVRQGDRGPALEHLAERLLHGWIEAPWGGDPATAPACEVITPNPWRLTGPRSATLKALATMAGLALGEMKAEIMKSAVIATIRDDDRAVSRSLQGPTFGDDTPEGAAEILGLIRPGEVDEFDVYVEWFHDRSLFLADAFLDEEGLMRSPSTLVPLGPSEALTDDLKSHPIAAVVREAIAAEMIRLRPRRMESHWAEALWTCPPETRLGVPEVAAAVGRPRSWVYRHTSPSGDLAPIPHRRLDGLLVFTAGDVRDWLRANEEAR